MSKVNIELFLRLIKKCVPHALLSFLRTPYHFFLALWSALFYGFPSRKLFVIGVTGTKGKTTVVELLHEIFKEAGIGIASVSSLRFKLNNNETKNDRKMTMPGRMFLQKFLHEAAKSKCSVAVIEVTSEGIKQSRHRFIGFDVAVMTNVAPEHIESHGSFENYLRAKLDLFWRLKKDSVAIINRDDIYADRFSAATGAKKIFYGKRGIETSGRILKLGDLSIGTQNISFDLESDSFSSVLEGEFNFYNILAAVSVGLAKHVASEKISAGLAKVSGIAGRMEYMQKEPFAVVVDYAHTPDSLRSVYGTLRGSRLICVLGSAGGGRDTWKRPVLGKIAGEFCSRIILTNEDPYDEDPEKILSDIKSGITSNQLPVVKTILDRREAIHESIKLAEAGDTIVITGKGAEPFIMGPSGAKIPWDDREVVKEELMKLK